MSRQLPENNQEIRIAVVGLGYVGLPLAVAFGEKYKTIGFDPSRTKISNYKNHIDPSGQVESKALKRSTFIEFTTDPRFLAEADFVVVCVPTPVTEGRIPDLSCLISASSTVGKYLKSGATVIYESTVYPGATEEVCIPVLEEYSKSKWKVDFNVGYSPERINPSDEEHTLSRVIKVVSGDSSLTLDQVASLYASIIEAGVHRASSIKVAEAAKVIENTQRDLNIALMNELAIICDKIDIDTNEVLNAAATKWNFLNFKPGLVGGHCIGVDPYYLTHKAEMLNYQPQVILAGRRINDGMGKFIAEKTVKKMIYSGCSVRGGCVNILGLTFKENCSDLRNSKVFDIVTELKSYGVEIAIHDPVADPVDAMNEYGVRLHAFEALPVADAIIVAVAHDFYREIGSSNIRSKIIDNGVFIDVKAVFNDKDPCFSGLNIWRL